MLDKTSYIFKISEQHIILCLANDHAIHDNKNAIMVYQIIYSDLSSNYLNLHK